MKYQVKPLVALTSLLALSTAAAAQENTALQDIIIVTGQKTSPQSIDEIKPNIQPIPLPDAVSLLSRLPGADNTNNGKLSGQVQYRGLFGPRLNIRVDGARFGSGGPGWMDPPLHYAPISMIERVELDRGISPVRSGPGLGGGANAIFKRASFTESSDFNLQYDVNASYRSVDNSTSVGGMVGTANDIFRLNVLVAREKGDDTKFPDGTIGGTSFERLAFGVMGGIKSDNHELSLSLRRHETDDTGNPPFPMDIVLFDANFVRARYKGNFDTVRVNIEAGGADIDHVMTNYILRPQPDLMRQRKTFADAKTRDVKADIGFNVTGGEMRLGIDWETREHNAQITNPNNAGFFLDNVPNATEDRTGIFTEWTGSVADWQAEIGGRVDWYGSSAGAAHVGAALPMMPRMLADEFNASSRVWEDTGIDGVVRLWRDTDGPFTWRVNLAHKTRAPGYLDRFAWLPTTASAGLADGNIYVGDLDIKSEKAWSGEVGFDYKSDFFYARPSFFYRSIDDYIQGVAFDNTPGVLDSAVERVAAMNGDPTPLRFANVDAKLYGFDMDFGMRFADSWRMDGVASFVRGRRRDIDDNLYRVAPPNLRLSGSYEQPNYALTLEGIFTAKQENVSQTNSEAPTGGHSIINAYGTWHASGNVQVSAGVENLFNAEYLEHLSGYNRNGGSDIALGARLPATGRGVFIKLAVKN